MKNAIEGKEEKAFPLSWEYVKDNEGIYESTDESTVAVLSDGADGFARILSDEFEFYDDCDSEYLMEEHTYRLLDKKLTLSND